MSDIPKVTGAPAEIWLVYGELDQDAAHHECEELMWCEDKQFDSDVRYVKANREPTRARKIGGSYQATGTIVSEFTTLAGQRRVVFEFDEPAGMLHIFNRDQIEFIGEQA